MITAVGLSHKTAPLPVRERFAFAPEVAARLIADLPGEAIVLVTCNRTELYTTAGADEAAQALVRAAGTDAPLVTRRGGEAVRHLLGVAAGLDSMVLGEPQILGQVKRALRFSQQLGKAGAALTRLGQQALTTGRRVRRETGLGRDLPSIPKVATEVARTYLGDLRGRTLLVIGAGKVGDLTARALRDSGAEIVVTNRTAATARALARSVGGRAEPIEALDRLLATADIVIACTGAPEPILAAPRVRHAARDRDLLLIDIAVPRDIAADVRTLSRVHLLDLDDLRGRASSTVAPEVVAQAASLVEQDAQAYLGWLAGREAVPTIQALRSRAEAILEEELGRAGGADAERLRAFGERLVNKLLHHPVVRMRDAAASQGATYLEVARDLFALDGDDV